MPKFRTKPVVSAAALMAGIALFAPVPAHAAPVPVAPAAPAALLAAPASAPFQAASASAPLQAAPASAPLQAAPASAPFQAAPAPGPFQLRDALLDASDLPRGYAPSSSGYMSAVSDLSGDTNICDHRVASPGHSPTAQAVFLRGIPGPMLFETLTGTGPRTARAIVAGIAAAPRRCHAFNDGAPDGAMQSQLQLFPMRVPRLGDASSGIRFSVRPAATNLVIQGRLISIARRGVAVTIILINAGPHDQRDLNTIAAAAVRKLDRAL
ncbi:hypothetical protein ACQP2F_22120 [Actinoplanes sp. CA-030573]|uniref:hypothetical protein n=1 Tax=Actinoplanes sp. CA-030573 TaxID=3239898 RepID=UPI003D8C95F8